MEKLNYSEIDDRIYLLMTKRGRRKTKGEQKKLFLNYLIQLKENFGITISTDYLKELLVFKGFNPRKATFSVSKFIKRNDLNQNLRQGNRDVLIKYYVNYGCNEFDECEIIGETSYNETLGFIPKFYKKEIDYINI